MSSLKAERYEKGKQRFRILAIIMVIAYLSYTVANIWVLHTKQLAFICLTVVSFLMTCFGYRWAKRIYYICAICYVGAGVLFVFGLVYHFFRFGKIYHGWFTCVFAGLLGVAHGISVYFLATEPVKSYLDNSANQRKQSKCKEKKERRR